MDPRRVRAGIELARDSPGGARPHRRTARRSQQGIRPGDTVDQEQRPRGNQRRGHEREDRKSTRLNSSHVSTSYAVFCLKKKRCGAPFSSLFPLLLYPATYLITSTRS